MNAASLLPSLPAGARLLIIRLRSIGDIVLLTPALRLLKEWRADYRISVLVETRFRELLEVNPDVEEIADLGGGEGRSKAGSIFRAALKLRRRKFSLCLNLHGGPTSAFLTAFGGARWNAGFKHFRARALYAFLIPDARQILGQQTIHTAEHQASALFWLGLPRREIPPARLFVSTAWEAWWGRKRASLGIAPDQEYALIHPTSLYPTKQWGPENFARLAEFLEAEAGLVPICSCGLGESPVLDAMEHAAGSPMRRLEGASLGQFAAALAGARLFVGNDSGPAHMAAALGRPSVVIFGSSSSAIWGPWPRQGPGYIVQNFFECNPCPGDRCYRFERPECILSVSFSQVRSAVEAILRQPARQS